MRYKIRAKGSPNMKVGRVVVEEGTRYYDTEYPHDFPAGNYFVDTFKCLPSYFGNESNHYKMDVYKCFETEDFKLVWTFTKPVKSEINTLIQVYEGDNVLVSVKYKASSKGSRGSLYDLGMMDEEDSSPDYALISIVHSNPDLVESINKKISKYVKDPKIKSKISLVTSSRSGLSTVEQNIKPTEINIPLNYGEGFVKIHEKIVEKLNEDKGKGLVLLHGVPGTGKTNYIRHLCGKLNKEIIFLPPFMADSIASPDFITFLLEHTNSILVIEDAEKVVLDREGDGSSRQGVSNLLNITDGLLSDCLSIQIIATFNTSRDRIDKALLRKGRLIAEWKFDSLSVEDTNKLLESLGREERTNKPLTLTEIYNMDEEVNVVQQERRAIGFGR